MVVRGAGTWSEPKTPSDLREILFDDASPDPELAGPPQRELFSSEAEAAPRVSAVRESEPTALDEPKIVEDDSESPTKVPVPGKKEMQLLFVMSGEMTRKEIRDALELKSDSYVKQQFRDPCLEKGWIKMTMPEKPSSKKQRFRITPDGRACVEAFEGE